MRFTVMTQNLWNTIRWDERKECVRSFFRLYSPDIICLQEVRPELLSWIDESLPDYSRIRDPFAGWTNEGSIYYRKGLFTEVCHGEVFLDMPEPDRRLFWARLRNSD
ncbi:MAG: endonuclease/exonuclease/phosphatase family protein, partial [Spirochaetales bacterium]|nr:endonuclease/exonuclease/phosphatase family protein [Spirochaetales bacterium]